MDFCHTTTRLNTVDAAVLVTHQPPDRLSPQNRKDVFHPLIAPSGRFVLSLCGHLHIAQEETKSFGGSAARRIGGVQRSWRWNPLLTGNNVCSATMRSKITIEPNSDHGVVRLWLRRSRTQKQSDDWSFGRDQFFRLEDDDGTRDSPEHWFEPRRSPLKTDKDRSVTGEEKRPLPPQSEDLITGPLTISAVLDRRSRSAND